MKTASAWLTYNGARAGLSAAEVWALPLGMVCDHIACWKISNGYAKERKQPASAGGSLFEQMQNIRR